MLKFKTLWAKHPTNRGDQKPCRTLGISNFTNQCSIRMGVCLRDAGVHANQIRGAKICSWAKATGHGHEYMHYIRASELAAALRNARIDGLGAVTLVRNPGDFANELNGRTGIIYFKNYWWRLEDTKQPTGDHIDLWNGWRTTAKMLFPWFGWLGGYNKSGEIWFWEVR